MVIDLQRKFWLLPLIKRVHERFESPISSHHATTFDAWCSDTLRLRGFITGTPAPRWTSDGQRNIPQAVFINTLTHHLEMTLEWLQRVDPSRTTLPRQLDLLTLVALNAGAWTIVENLITLNTEAWCEGPREALNKQLEKPSRQLGAQLKESVAYLRDAKTLKWPFQRVILYAEARQRLEMLRLFTTTPIQALESHQMYLVLAQCQEEKRDLIRAVIALAQADGHISKLEERVIDEVITLAKLPAHERKALHATLHERLEPEDVALAIQDPMSRRFIFEQVLLCSMLEGPANEDERRFIERFGDALQLDEAAQLRCQGEALTFFEAHPKLASMLSRRGLISRLRARVSSDLETMVRVNMARIMTEARETKELAILLAKQRHQPLNPNEAAKVKEQLLDICRTIPSLAIFALPGGTLLLPIIMKLLPFDLMPSAFRDHNEGL